MSQRKGEKQALDTAVRDWTPECRQCRGERGVKVNHRRGEKGIPGKAQAQDPNRFRPAAVDK